MRYADSPRSGERIEADFELAVWRHRLLDVIQRRAASGTVVRITEQQTVIRVSYSTAR